MALSYGLCLGPSSAKDSSNDMCRAMCQLTGDGVCQGGSRFEASADGMALTLGSGFGLAAGRWVEIDGPLELEVSPGYQHADRQDMAVMQMDLKARKVSLGIVESAYPEALPDEPYTVPLYLLNVKRGATNLLPDDVTDMRSYVPQLSELSPDGLRAFEFTHGGLDRRVEDILEKGQQIIESSREAVVDLSAYIEQSGIGPGIGELTTGRQSPGKGWLRCDGGYIPAGYRELRAMLGNFLPDIDHADERYSTWVYGGEY